MPNGETRKLKPTHRSSINYVLVLENPIENRRICKHHEPKASGLPSILLPHNWSVNDIAIVAIMLLELILRCLPWYPTNEKLPLIRIHFAPSLTPSLYPSPSLFSLGSFIEKFASGILGRFLGFRIESGPKRKPRVCVARVCVCVFQRQCVLAR